MARMHWFILLSTFLSAMLILLGIISFAPSVNEKDNGFTRAWMDVQLEKLSEKELRFSANTICGLNSKSVILAGRSKDGYSLFTVGAEEVVSINIHSELQKLLIPPVNILTSGNDIFFLINNSATLLRGHINGDGIEDIKSIRLEAPLFTRVSLFTPSTLILRAFDSTSQYQQLQTVDLKTGSIKAVADIFGHSRNEMFLTDGMLEFDSVNNQAVYVQYYSNKIYCLDSNLSLQYINKTIDTVGTGDPAASTRIVSVGNRETFVPPVTINERCSIDGGYLFVLSKLRADNEINADFNSSSTFDVYQTQNGNYLGSFHLPNLNGHKVVEFRAKNGVLYVLSGKFLATYRISI